MREMTMKKAISQVAHILAPIVLVFSLSATAFAAAPGITGPTFNLTAQQAYLNQPDGEAVYSWGYGCNGTPAGFAPTLNGQTRSEEHTSELQSLTNLVCRLLLVKKNFSILSVLAFMVCWVSSPE